MSNNIQKLYENGQSIWCDNISRAMLDGGELNRLIDLGIVGVTSNPTIFMKAITGSNDYDKRLSQLLQEGLALYDIYEGLVLPDIADAADILKPIFDKTEGVDGYISLEVNPKLAYDTAGTIEEGRRLFKTLNKPNLLIKVPATEEGMPAIESLISEGINVNVTLIFGLDMYEKVIQAYANGLRKLSQAGGDVSRVSSVASFFVSRVDTVVDKILAEKKAAGADVDHLLSKTAIANGRLAYALYKKFFEQGEGFADLKNLGARVQRPLWASTSVKNSAYPPTMYVENLIAKNSVNTLPPQSIEAVLADCPTDVSIENDLDKAKATLAEIASLGIDINSVTKQLLDDGVKQFAKSFDDLLASLQSKQEALQL